MASIFGSLCGCFGSKPSSAYQASTPTGQASPKEENAAALSVRKPTPISMTGMSQSWENHDKPAKEVKACSGEKATQGNNASVPMSVFAAMRQDVNSSVVLIQGPSTAMDPKSADGSVLLADLSSGFSQMASTVSLAPGLLMFDLWQQSGSTSSAHLRMQNRAWVGAWGFYHCMLHAQS